MPTRPIKPLLHRSVRALHGSSLLAFDAVRATTDIVEAMHATIAALSLPLGTGATRTRGLTAGVYGAIRGVTGLLRQGVDASLRGVGAVTAAEPLPAEPREEAALAALNGVLGDHLEATGNPLAIRMQLRRAGLPLTLTREALADALPQAGPRLLVQVHGLCMNDLQWRWQGHDHGELLEAGHGYTAVQLHYNSGRHVSQNGRELAGLLELLVAHWPVPVEALVLLGHSMGGLVSRSAVHYGRAAGQRWSERLAALVFLGTPHHGAPAERIGSLVQRVIGWSPYSAPIGRIATLRSAGITDLRHGNLIDADWDGHDRFDRADRRLAHALPVGIDCYTVAATKSPPEHPKPAGDGLVPVDSALGRHRDPARTLDFGADRQRLIHRANHWDLLLHPEVTEALGRWLA
ncbi:MAG: GPI inositol-deacylase [Xanthomonadales bacterium]|nr:GPI inositol-deacylase [Xanthomonadales bacterium]